MMMPDLAQLAKPFLWLFYGVGFAMMLVFIAICFITMKIYSRIPEEYRELNPVLVWLLFVPCFNLIWIFFVFPRLATSLKNYFDDIGDESVGDCGRALAVVA
ncbi:MAG: hypothetical protein D6820_07465, partial [Lentisphaerae bacterium]